MNRDKFLEVFLDNTAKVGLYKGILTNTQEVFFLNLVKEVLTANIGDEKGLSGSASLQCDLGSILKVTNEKVPLDNPFNSLVPVDVSLNSLCNEGYLGLTSIRSTKIFLLATAKRSLLFLIIVDLLFLVGTSLSTKLIKEVSGRFSRHGQETRLGLLDLNLLRRGRRVLLWWLEELTAETLFYFSDNLDLIVAESLEQIRVLSHLKTLKDGVLKLINFVIGFIDSLFEYLRQILGLQFLVKVGYPLRKTGIHWLLMDGNEWTRGGRESNEAIAKTKAGSTSRLIEFWRRYCLDRSCELAFRLSEKPFGLKRKDGCVALCIHAGKFTFQRLRERDLLEGGLGRKFQDSLSSL